MRRPLIANVRDLLKGSQPKRLVAEGGEWHLEVQRMVNVGGGVLRPETRRISGQRAILELLQHSEQHRALKGPTERLFLAPPSDNERSYNPVGGSWIPTEIIPSYIESLRTRPAKNGDQGLVGELLAEVTLLRVAQESLLSRLQRLETLVMNGHVVAKKEGSARGADGPGAHGHAAGNDLGALPAPAAAAGSPEGAPSPPSPSEATVASGGAEESAVDPSLEAAAERPKIRPESLPPLKMPELASVASLLSQLVGETYTLRPIDGAPSIEPFVGSVGSVLIDDAEQLAGILLADPPAAVRLGGTLLMLPQAELESQIADNAPSEDVLSAMSEVFNNLSGTLNQVKGNRHVRSTPIESIDLDSLSPFADPRTFFRAEVQGVGVITILGV